MDKKNETYAFWVVLVFAIVAIWGEHRTCEKKLETLASNWYLTRDFIYEMVDANEKVFQKLDISGDADYYNYYNFDYYLSNYDNIMQKTTDIAG